MKFDDDDEENDFKWYIVIVLLISIFTLPGLIVICIWGYLLLRLIAHLTNPNKENKQ